MKKVTVQQLSTQTGIKPRTIQARAKRLGFEPDEQLGRLLFTAAQAKQITDYSDRRRQRRPESALQPQSVRARRYRDSKAQETKNISEPEK